MTVDLHLEKHVPQLSLSGVLIQVELSILKRLAYFVDKNAYQSTPKTQKGGIVL